MNFAFRSAYAPRRIPPCPAVALAKADLSAIFVPKMANEAARLRFMLCGLAAKRFMRRKPRFMAQSAASSITFLRFALR